jgi:CubicO group peptidase (beta-lactamase class C family)
MTEEASMTRRAIMVGAGVAATANVSSANNAQAQAISVTAQPDTGEHSAANFMQGFPPAQSTRVDVSNWQTWPQAKWSVRHMREIFGSRDATQLQSRSLALREAPMDMERVRLRTAQGETGWSQFEAATHTDAIIILVNGRIVYERYLDGMQPADPHILFSATKSYCGFLAEILAARGQLDFSRPVQSYLPELAATGFAGASVRQIADMTDGARFSENYTDPNADVFRYLADVGLGPRDGSDPPRGTYAALQSINAREHPPGHAFAYRSAVTDVLAWVVQRVANKSLSQLYAEEVHAPIGAADPAYFTLDAVGQEVAAGGLNISLRDFARFGEMLRRRGRVGSRQVFPTSAIDSIFAGGDKEAFARGNQPTRPGWSYRSQFWCTHDARSSVWLLGVRGQRLVIVPSLNLVMAKFGSHPVLSNSATDAIHGAALDALEAALA